MTVKSVTPTIVESPQEPDIVVSIDRVSKKFCRNLKRSLFYGIQDIAAELTGRQRQSQILREQEFWALKDVSLQLKRGEALGLVGCNGAGKSTLLRIVSGLIHPDTGSVKIKGRVAPLIALGAGFNPILTGKENIYANMSILGLSTQQIRQKFDDVVDFAEIWEAIDAPVQTYSSGMAARLGFACAIYVEPEILLIDEVLAVGDIKFRMKCYKRLAEQRKKGTAFILVSHNSHNILNICESAVYLNQGKLMAVGESGTVINQYEQDLGLNGVEVTEGILKLPPKPEHQSMGIDITTLSFKNEAGNVIKYLTSGKTAYLSVECQANIVADGVNLGVKIKALSAENEMVLYLTSASDNCLFKVQPGIIELQLKFDQLGLIPGVYNAKIYLKSGVCSFDIVESFRFTVKSNQAMSNCLYYQPCDWKIIQS
jgi:lipopolysaccharide transport system ATP-binding protein